MATLSSSHARAIARRILAGADDVLDTVVAVHPHFLRPDHMRDLADFWAGVARGQRMRLVFASAPRWGKSETNCVGAAWAMLCRPGLRVLLVSATQTLAEELSHKIREVAQRIGLVIPHDQRALGHWRASNGSELRAYSYGSTLLGVPADVLVADDLLRGMDAANSPTQREAVDEWFRSTAISRLQPGASAVLCQHRWAIDDISQQLTDRGWPTANVPARDFTTGKSTFPALWSEDELAAKEKEVGPILWAAQYQGCPSPRGGAVFTGPPTTYSLLELGRMFAEFQGRIIISCDPAATAKTSADWSVIVVALHHGTGLEAKMDIIDIWRGQVEIPTLVDKLQWFQRRWKAPVVVEKNGLGVGVEQYLRQAGAGAVRGVQSTRDKLTRALPLSAAWSRGCVRFSDVGAHWLPYALREFASFTGSGADTHDDLVDACTLNWNAGIGAMHADVVRQRHARMVALLPWG
ncbi:MAG TPA: hypothetical protein VGM90_14905 [Kofleriaceae bacterium]|jgi:predicted phage terminase large subunit-like protein